VADRGANAAFAAADLGVLDADAVLVSGYLVLADDTATPAASALAAPARWVAVDAAAAGLVHAVGADEARRRFGPARVLLANAVEATALTGLGDPEAAARELAALHEVVIVKLGPEGALGVAAAEAAHVPAAGGDPWLGDGDAFDGGVLAGLAGGLGLRDALELGTRAAGLRSE
jgi:sugar/nucleoside kinase (ribokinase family)